MYRKRRGLTAQQRYIRERTYSQILGSDTKSKSIVTAIYGRKAETEWGAREA